MLAQQAFHAWGFDVAPPTVSDPARCHREDCGYMDILVSSITLKKDLGIHNNFSKDLGIHNNFKKDLGILDDSDKAIAGAHS